MSRHLCLSLVAALLWVSPSPAQFLGRSVEAWLGGLRSAQPVVRRNAPLALGKMGREGAPPVRGLRTGLTDTDAQVREAAANALGELIRDSFAISDPRLAESLADMLQDADPLVKRSAVYAL